MTGVTCALIGFGSSRAEFTVTEGSYEDTSSKVTVTYTGYAGYLANTPATFGSVSPATAKGANIYGIYTSPGLALELSGNRASSFITSMTINGTDVGAVSSTEYYPGADKTIFYFGIGSYFDGLGTSTVVIT